MLALISLAALAGSTTSKALIGYPPGSSGDLDCTVHLVVDKEGKAKHVLSQCPGPFADRARDAMSKWRWEPDGTVFVEERTIKFKQNAPWASPSSATLLNNPEDVLIRDVHQTEVGVVERFPPKYPVDANGTEGRCKATAVVPVAGGAPSFVGADGCEEVFHKAVRKAIGSWSFEPLEDAGDAKWFRTRLVLDFKEPAPPKPLGPRAYAKYLNLEQSALPNFPQKGKKHVPTTCTVEFTVTERGTVKDPSVTGCDPLFHVTTENAALRWKYSHTGDPRSVRVVERVTFVSKKDIQREE